MSSPMLRVGTRGSALALAQARLVAEALDRAGARSELAIVETEGDRRAPDTAWGEGAFVTAIERALVAGRVDVAVHSAKDVPTDEDERLLIAAYLPREDARDVLVRRRGEEAPSIDALPGRTRVGTDSPRRTAFLLARRPDLRLHPLYGNVDTRLRKLDDGETDALILAAAGLSRLGRLDRAASYLEADVVPPAPGQGAIAVQVRATDEAVVARVRSVDDVPTRTAVEAERAFLHRSGGGCRAPIGAFATVDGDRFRMIAGYAMADGSAVAVETGECPVAQSFALVEELVERLTARLPGARVPVATVKAR